MNHIRYNIHVQLSVACPGGEGAKGHLPSLQYKKKMSTILNLVHNIHKFSMNNEVEMFRTPLENFGHTSGCTYTCRSRLLLELHARPHHSCYS